MAKAAELNGYPGPRHVLELADELELTPEERERSRAIFERMNESAIHLGKQVMEKERALDQAFSRQEIDRERLELLTRKISNLKARLRYVHLVAHLEQRSQLTEAQVKRYGELRGYIHNTAGNVHDHNRH